MLQNKAIRVPEHISYNSSEPWSTDDTGNDEGCHWCFNLLEEHCKPKPVNYVWASYWSSGCDEMLEKVLTVLSTKKKNHGPLSYEAMYWHSADWKKVTIS